MLPLFNSVFQVKKALGIKSFHGITKSKAIEVASLIPDMDENVATEIIKQFPEYASFVNDIVTKAKEMYSNTLSDNKENQKVVTETFRKVLDDFGEILKKENNSPEERAVIMNNIMLVLDKMSKKDTENKEFLENMFKFAIVGILFAALGIVYAKREKLTSEKIFT